MSMRAREERIESRGIGFQPMSHRQDVDVTRFEIPAFARLRRGRRHSRLGAAALMLSLWALFLLSAMVISWALEIDSRLAISGHANRSLEAEAMACSGVEVALHPLVTPASPNLSRQMDRRESYETHITGE